MIVALILAISAAIIFGALFFDERGIVKKYFEDSVKESPKDVSAPSVDDQDLRELTPDLVVEAVKFNGYVPDKNEDSVFFMVQGEKFLVTTDNLPFLSVTKVYGIDKDQTDIELMRKAAFESTFEKMLGKAFLSDDGNTLYFNVSAIEPQYGRFRNMLGRYVAIVSELEARFSDTYNKLLNDKRDLEKLESNGIEIPQPAGREGKIVS